MISYKKITSFILSCAGSVLLCSCAGPRHSLALSEPAAFGVGMDSMVEPAMEIEPVEAGVSRIAPEKKMIRQIILNSDLYLLVDNIAVTQNAIIQKTEQLNGYMQSMNSKIITLRIPSKSFKTFIAEVGALGKVTDQSINAQDITQEMMDLDIRLDNAERLRKRYAELLAKGGEVKELLEIEKALSEVTEKIERLKGTIRYYKNQVAYSTVRVHLNSSVPQIGITNEIPVEWVRELGKNIGDTAGINMSSSSKLPVVNFELPKSFVMASSWWGTRVMSPKGVYGSLVEYPNLQNGTLKFWSEIIERGLEKSSAVKVLSNERLLLDTEWPFNLIRAEKVIGRQKFSYYLAVSVLKDDVYIYDAWGVEDVFTDVKVSIVASMKTMHIGTWFDRIRSSSLLEE